MTTQDEAIHRLAATPPLQADRGPRVTLQVLRVAVVVHSLAFLVQPVFAGEYLMGDVDALALHGNNSAVIAILDAIQLVCAVVYFWKGRGRAWPIWASLAIALLVEVQAGLGSARVLVVHLPLGVSLIVGQILTTVWLFRAAAATPRPRRSGPSKPERAR